MTGSNNGQVARMRDLARVYAMLAKELDEWQEAHDDNPTPPNDTDAPIIWKLHRQVTLHNLSNEPKEQASIRAAMDALVTSNGGPAGFKWPVGEVEDLEKLMLEGWAYDLAPYNKPEQTDAPHAEFW